MNSPKPNQAVAAEVLDLLMTPIVNDLNKLLEARSKERYSLSIQSVKSSLVQALRANGIHVSGAQTNQSMKNLSC